MMRNNKKFLLKRSAWLLLTVFFTVFFVIMLAGGNMAVKFAPALNGFFGTNPYRRIVSDKSTGPETDYFKSDFVKKDGNGNALYEKDADGTWRPIYDDAAMRANSQDVALQAAVEGTVILSNDDALPLDADTRVSMFGVSSVNYQFLGVGSGGMTISTPQDLNKTFAKYGLALNTDLYWEYFNLFSAGNGKYTHVRCKEVNEVPWSEINAAAKASVTADDVAVMTISRTAGEKWDITPTNRDSFVDPENFLDLSVDEREVLTQLIAMRDDGKLARVVLLINSANAVQFANIKELNLDACVWVGMGGTMAYEQIASVLSGRGDYVVSGRLPDAYAYNNYSAPSIVNFGDFWWSESGSGLPDPENNQYGRSYNTRYVAYQEGIYIGYRYYETRYEDCVLGQGNAASNAGVKAGKENWNYSEEVAYPFGYGKSYAEFAHSDYDVTKNKDGDYEVSMRVKNLSDEYKGKDVLQVYLQKPYLKYDIDNCIEKASVELVGFAKTPLLAPHDETTITVTVKAEQLKTYDAYGQHTYILEKGDYYLAAGENSHDALNNILAAKGKTTADGMDYNGDESFAHKIVVETEDYNTYKYSSYTGAEITNRFDDADINRYDGSGQRIDYLSRSDWYATYPKAATILKCTSERMIDDMQYGHPTEAKAGDKLPVYDTITSQTGELTIAMMMDLKFDDPLWQDLLNQTTVKEQQYLISYGLHHIAGVKSVGAPGLDARDGPAGMKTGNPTLKSTIGFPCEVQIAATFNLELVGRLGEAFGMEVLHCYYTVIYAPGGCIHRNAYGGRNWEYYSEDGFLSGKMMAVECKGIQKYGVIVETKHFVLNEQETNRHGVATFATEQSVREIYLKAFELGVAEGKMNGIMTSFNRIGCTWVGAHKGLMNDVLRGEWGFVGIVETDCCLSAIDDLQHILHPYAVAEGLIAGNDVWMCGTGSEEFIKEFENNPTVMIALRNATHRILYAQLHSNGMNGMDETTRIAIVKVWWELLLDGLSVGMGVLAGLLLLMTVASFIVCSDWFKGKTAAARAKRSAVAASGSRIAAFGKPPGAPRGQGVSPSAPAGGCGDGGGPGKGGVGKKFLSLSVRKKIVVCVSAALIVAIVTLSVALPIALLSDNKKPDDDGGTPVPVTHVCGHVCPECGKCLDTDCADEVCGDKCGGHVHVCECECPICGKCYDLYCEEPVCAEKCGDGRTATVFEAEQASFTNGTSAIGIKTDGKNKETYVNGLNKNRGASMTFSVYSAVETTASLVPYVSQRSVDFPFGNMLVQVNKKGIETNAVVPGTGANDEWRTFVPVNLGCIRLIEGENTIKITVTDTSEYSGLNFDKIVLLGDHMCGHVCPECGKCLDKDCGEEACKDKCEGHVHVCESKCPICGKCYDLTCEEAVCAEKCGENGTPVEYEGEDAALTPGAKGNLKHETTNGVTYVSNTNNNEGAQITFSVKAEKDSVASLVVHVSRRYFDLVFTREAMEVTVNNNEVTSDAVVPATDNGKDDWRHCAPVNLGCVRLTAGENTIVFTVRPGLEKCVNLDKIVLLFGESDEPPAHVCGSVCPECGKCLDTGCEAPECAEKCQGHVSELTLEAESSVYRPATGQLKPQNGGSGQVLGINKMKDTALEFGVYSQAPGVEKLYISLSRRALLVETDGVTTQTAIPFKDVYSLTVNGDALDTEDAAVGLPSNPSGDSEWGKYDEIYLGEARLIAGVNIIRLTVISADDKGSNVDYLKLAGKSQLTAIDLNRTLVSPMQKFEAEFAEISNSEAGKTPGLDKKICVAQDGGKSMMIGMNNLKGAGVQFTIRNAGGPKTVNLYATLTKRKTENVPFNDVFDVIVNGVTLDKNKVSGTIPADVTGDKWNQSAEVSLCRLELAADTEYTILFKVTDSSDKGCNFDYIKLETVGS